MDKADFFFRDTTLHMYYGHEGWLEPDQNVHELGKKAELCFKWGHNMGTDGVCSLERLQAWLTSPSLQITPCTFLSGEGPFYRLSFCGEEAGLYEVLVKHSGIISVTKDGGHVWGSRRECPDALETRAFTQFSKCLVCFGNGKVPMPAFTQTNLDLLPLNWGSLKIGSPASFQAIFKGVALEQGEVLVVRRGKGPPVIDTFALGAGGEITFIPDLEGKYLLLIRHKDETDREKGYYDKKSYTCVYSFRLTNVALT